MRAGIRCRRHRCPLSLPLAPSAVVVWRKAGSGARNPCSLALSLARGLDRRSVCRSPCSCRGVHRCSCLLPSAFLLPSLHSPGSAQLLIARIPPSLLRIRDVFFVLFVIGEGGREGGWPRVFLYYDVQRGWGVWSVGEIIHYWGKWWLFVIVARQYSVSSLSLSSLRYDYDDDDSDGDHVVVVQQLAAQHLALTEALERLRRAVTAICSS